MSEWKKYEGTDEQIDRVESRTDFVRWEDEDWRRVNK